MAEAGIAALPIATLTTDFGTADGYVAAMKGVMLGINPGLALVDVSHEVPPQNVPHGAFVLAEAVRYFPAGAVHLAVVDPGVGGRRKPLLLVTPDASYVAPDNGLLTHALARYGSAHDPRAEWLSPIRAPLPPGCRAFELANARYRLPEVSQTFHGRDVFAPAAAHLSAGVPPEEFGPPVTEVIWLNVPPPAEGNGEIEGRVVHVDHFGNLISNIALDDSRAGGVVVEMEGLRVEGLSHSYEEADGVLAIVGSHGTVEIAVRDASAARQLGAGVGARVRVCYHKPVNSNAPARPPDPEKS